MTSFGIPVVSGSRFIRPGSRRVMQAAVPEAVTIGPDEAANGQVAVKNLATGEQVSVTREAVVETVRRILA